LVGNSSKNQPTPVPSNHEKTKPGCFLSCFSLFFSCVLRFSLRSGKYFKDATQLGKKIAEGGFSLLDGIE